MFDDWWREIPMKKTTSFQAAALVSLVFAVSPSGAPALAEVVLPGTPGPAVKSGRVPSAALPSGSVHILPPPSRPHGKSYSQWAAAWWQWALEADASENPLTDTTGEFCHVDQGGHVFFLAGTFGQSVERDCTIGTGKALLFPIANSFFGTLPGDPPEQQTEEYCRAQVDSTIDPTNILSLSVDGKTAPGLLRFAERSVLFPVQLPENNIFGIVDPDPAARLVFPTCDAGYYVYLPPLPPGEHTLHWTASTANNIEQDVTYCLSVVPGARR
jgi:hypothetical protein